MTFALELLALISASIYAGSTYYVGMVEQPSRLERRGALDVGQWQRANDRTPRYAASALVGAGAAVLLAPQVAVGWPWILGALLLLAVLPWTLLMMLPIQRRLTDRGWRSEKPETLILIERWGRFHLARLALGLGALGLFLWAVLR